MNRYFLIDFENVADAGLEGFFDLDPNDTVYVFYTANANKINIRFLSELTLHAEKAGLKFIKVANGKQALDFQLSSYLGLLVSEKTGDDVQFFIVSKDNGFSCLPLFWRDMKGNRNIRIIKKLADVQNKRSSTFDVIPEPEVPEVTAEPEETVLPVAEAEPVLETVPVSLPEEEPAAEKTPALWSEIILPAAEPVKEPEAESAPAVKTEEQPAPAEEKQEKSETAPKKASRKRKKPAKKAAEPAEEPAGEPVNAEEPAAEENPRKLTSEDRTALNDRIQIILSKAKVDSETVGAVASLVNKTVKGGADKRNVYLALLKAFGQKKGLDLYNMIKPALE